MIGGYTYAESLQVEMNHVMKGGRTYIFGSTNLPGGTRLGLTVSDKEGYSAQDFKIFTKGDGSFKSTGFTSKGSPLSGPYTAELFTYLNNIWQNPDILTKLIFYTGYGIDDGKMSIEYTFVASSASASIDQNQAQMIVANLAYNKGGTIEQFLNEQANLPAIKDFGWETTKSETGSFIVERTQILNKRLNLIYRWEVTPDGAATPVNGKAIGITR